jgi:hypothetical protein
VQLARQELALGRFDNGFEMVPAGSKGLFLERSLISSKSNQIEILRLDTSLTTKWHGFIPIDKNYLVFGHQYFDDKLFLLLRYRDYTKKDLRLIAVNADSATYIEYKIKGYIAFNPVEFQVMPRGVAIGGYFGRTPLVLFYSFIDHRSKVLPGLLNEAGELNQIKFNNDETFDVLISGWNYQRQKTMWIKRYDYQGNLLSNVSLDSQDNKHLIFGRLLTTDDDMQIIAGVYGNRFSDYSRGVFICSIDAAGYQQVKYYNFGDLENFFKYMKAKKEKRVKNRIERRKVKGKKIRFNYRFLVHQFIPYNGQFLMLGEAFYPKYTYQDRAGFFTQPGYYGPVQNGRLFEGYYYTHAVIIAFNEKGDLLWDNSFEINDIKSFKLEQFVQARLFEDKIALFYFYDNKVRSKLIHKNQVLEANIDEIDDRELPGEIAKTDKGSPPQLEYWYRDFFLANGVQNIETRSGRHKRRVYFVDKIAYREK